MKIITNNQDLAQFCESLKEVPYITVDTEFLREKTYYAKLCLIQVSGPDKQGALIDVIEGDIDLAPLLELFRNEDIIKVFHACRQDLEIFYQLFHSLPRPLFDTQVAAMVCGFGEQIGFQPLVTQLTEHPVDKGQQYTDWSKRPLSDKQKESFLNPALYDIKPEEAWKRIKIKSPKPRQMAVLKEVAAWREAKAQKKDIPKGRILRDETLVDISYNPPKKPEDLIRIRNFPKGCETKELGHAILSAVKTASKVAESDCPVLKKKPVLHRQYQGVYEMLKMVLKICAVQNDVASKLISSNDDLEILARDGAKAEILALKGWRKDVFGNIALEIISGEKALKLIDGDIRVI